MSKLYTTPVTVDSFLQREFDDVFVDVIIEDFNKKIRSASSSQQDWPIKIIGGPIRAPLATQRAALVLAQAGWHVEVEESIRYRVLLLVVSNPREKRLAVLKES